MIVGNTQQPLADVRRLAADEADCEIFGVVLEELRRHGLDSDDLREILKSELGDSHCFKSKPTKKYFPDTTSDYYSIWIEDCNSKMFLKLLIADLGDDRSRLVITSFKRDDRYGS